MFVIKNGKSCKFNRDKIRNAVIQAANQVSYPDFDAIDNIVDEIEDIIFTEHDNQIQVNEIENLVMSVLYREMPAAGRVYSAYKMERERMKKNPTETEKVLYGSEEIDKENANKKANLGHIVNAYLAEIPSKEEFFKQFPQACVEAHNRGVVYAHDSGYSIRPLHNCELLNLDYLLQHGCKINGTWVDKPHSFWVACSVASQILTHVTSNTYGGCTVNLLALAKFVDISRKKIREEVKEEWEQNEFSYSEEQLNRTVERRLNREINQGIQTFTYQNQTLCADVGQAVFLTVSVYLNEDPEYTNDLILIFKELLRQRIKGVPNEQSIYENTNFPKILYFLDEDTMRGGKYYDITRICAKCSAMRLVPDYMSVKKHLEMKGVVTPSMGCRALLSPYKDENGNFVTWGRFNCGRLINAA